MIFIFNVHYGFFGWSFSLVFFFFFIIYIYTHYIYFLTDFINRCFVQKVFLVSEITPY